MTNAQYEEMLRLLRTMEANVQRIADCMAMSVQPNLIAQGRSALLPPADWRPVNAGPWNDDLPSHGGR